MLGMASRGERMLEQRDAILVAAGAGLLFMVFAQRAFHGADALGFLRALAVGDLRHPHHPLYVPLLAGSSSMLGWFGVSSYRAAVFASGLGAAIGCGCAYLAARTSGSTPLRAVATAALVAATPAVLFFATVVEVPGVLLGFAGIGWLLAARLAAAAPGAQRLLVAALGASTAVAAAVHATGHLLPCWLLPWALRARRRRDALGLAGVGLAAHVLLTLFFTSGLHALGWPIAAGEQGAFVWEHLRQVPRFDLLLQVVWNEWLHAFLPISVLVLAGAWRSELRAHLRLFGAALLVHLLVTFVLVRDANERGAYLVPLVLPCAWLCARALAPALLGLALVIGATCAVWQVAAHDVVRGEPHFVQDLRAATSGQRPFLFLFEFGEMETILRDDPSIPFASIDPWFQVDAKALPHALASLDAVIAEQLRTGMTVYLAESAYVALGRADRSLAGPEILRHLQTRYPLTCVERGAFRARRLGPP